MRHRRTRDIVIELTSLLDIVMILIFAVMIENSRLVEAGREELTDKSNLLQEVQAELADSTFKNEGLTGQLEETLKALDICESELASAKSDLKSTSEEKEAQTTAYAVEKAALEQENQALNEENLNLSSELEEALGKLSEGDVQSLLERVQKAEMRNNAYKYMEDIVIVFDIGLENKYNGTCRVLTYGNAARPEESQYYEISKNSKTTIGDFEWNHHINTLKAYLTERITEALGANSEASVYLVFSFNNDDVYVSDRESLKNTLRELSELDGNGRIKLKINNN